MFQSREDVDLENPLLDGSLLDVPIQGRCRPYKMKLANNLHVAYMMQVILKLNLKLHHKTLDIRFKCQCKKYTHYFIDQNVKQSVKQCCMAVLCTSHCL